LRHRIDTGGHVSRVQHCKVLRCISGSV